MLTFFTIIHVLLCVFMMFVILLQPGKDAGMGAALGGGAATSAFGGRGAVTFLSKLTAVCAALFFITSLGLSFVGMKSSVVAGVVLPSKKAPRAVSDGGTAPAESAAQGEAVPGEPQDAPISEEAAPEQTSTEKPTSSDAKKAPAAAPAPKPSPSPKKR
jgi:preprotein translocase subunit SecG